MNEDLIAKQIYEGKVDELRRGGRPKKKWLTLFR